MPWRRDGSYEYTDLSRQRAMLALPILVRQAQLAEPITYGDLALELGLHPRAIRHVLGYIRDEVCTPRKLPLLNILVVSKDTGVPGESFLPDGSGWRMSVVERRERLVQAQAELSRVDWSPLLRELGLRVAPLPCRDLEAEAREYERSLRRGGAGEGPIHKRLKAWIAAHPSSIGLGGVTKTTIEYMHPSGDECDVVFDRGSRHPAVVEVKVGERGELVKGVYQAVKYRALLEAERGRGKAYSVDAHLVAHAMPDDIASLAARLGVSIHVIAPELLG